MKPPKVSVIVPSYNKPEYLPECLRSVQAQTFTDWECIVVNDGSPRGDEIRAAVAAMNDPRFRLVEHEINRGLAAARNTGVKAAKAELVICLDEDDCISPNCLEVLVGTIEQTSVEIVVPYAHTMGDEKCIFKCEVPNLPESLLGGHLLGAGFMMQKQAWSAVGGWDESSAIRAREDVEWWIRVISQGVRLTVVPQALYQLRPRQAPEDYMRSLNWSCRERETSYRRYIIDKHRTLYNKFPEYKKLFLARGFELQAEWMVINGRLWSSRVLFWLAFLVSPSGSRLRKAIIGTIGETLGSVLIAVMRITRSRALKHLAPHA
jgi:glycosyltransferase involved in cell wall biosynthesis